MISKFFKICEDSSDDSDDESAFEEDETKTNSIRDLDDIVNLETHQMKDTKFENQVPMNWMNLNVSEELDTIQLKTLVL